jgi:hypothetical protein
MAYQDFTSGWTETDPSAKITVSSSRVTWTSITFSQDSAVAKDASVGFTGDWDIAFDFRIDSGSDVAFGVDNIALNDSTAKFVSAVQIGEAASSKVRVKLYNIELNTYGEDSIEDTTTLAVNTVYYARWRRDDDAGTYGTLYLDIYGSSANRDAGASVLVSLTRTITVFTKVDMTVCKICATFDASDTNLRSGYLENLDLAYVPAATETFLTGVHFFDF